MPDLIYLASPYSHEKEIIREIRFDTVCRVTARYLGDGVFIYSPIAHNHSVAKAGNLPQNYHFWKKHDIHFLKLCAEMWVLCLSGWKDSQGVTDEIKIVTQMKKPIVYLDERGEKLTRSDSGN